MIIPLPGFFQGSVNICNMNFIVKNIPNSITCMNLACGVMAILSAVNGDSAQWGLTGYEWCWIFIGLAAVADFLDGFCARLLKAYSDLGKELDSLCDLVSFGVAPAILVFNCLKDCGNVEWIAWLAILIPVTGALRLARFNVDTRQTLNFIGLPIPANAIFWIGYSAMCYEGIEFLSTWYWFIPIVIMESWLMISPVNFFSLKFKTWTWKGNQWRWLLIITTIGLVAIMGMPGLLWTIVVYAGYSIFERTD